MSTCAVSPPRVVASARRLRSRGAHSVGQIAPDAPFRSLSTSNIAGEIVAALCRARKGSTVSETTPREAPTASQPPAHPRRVLSDDLLKTLHSRAAGYDRDNRFFA